MKNYLTLCLILVSGLSLKAQNDLQAINTNYLQGTWLIDTMYLDFELSEQMMSVYAERFRELKETTRFVFREDGTYEKVSKDAPRTGTWEISPNGNMIIIHFDDSDETSRTLISVLDESHLTMLPVDESAQNSKVELVKQK